MVQWWQKMPDQNKPSWSACSNAFSVEHTCCQHVLTWLCNAHNVRNHLARFALLTLRPDSRSSTSREMWRIPLRVSSTPVDRAVRAALAVQRFTLSRTFPERFQQFSIRFSISLSTFLYCSACHTGEHTMCIKYLVRSPCESTLWVTCESTLLRLL